jgi:hypothetical protein
MNARIIRSRPTLAASLALLAIAGGIVSAGGAAQPAPEPLLLTGARILDARSGRYLAAGAVLILGDRIQSISSSAPATLPPNTRRLDLSGTTLVPGLGDMFAAASPDGSADADFYYAMALAHGVTQYRVVGAKLPWAASQRQRARSGDILAPRLTIGGPRLDQIAVGSFTTRTVPDPQAARRAVAEQASLGAEWVSAGATTAPEVLRAIVAAARAGKVRASGEPGATPLAELLRLGVDAVDRIGFFARSAADCEKELRARPDFPTQSEAVVDYLWRYASAADLRPVLPRAVRGRVSLIPQLASFGGTLDVEDLRNDAAVGALPQRWRDALTARAHPPGWPGSASAARAADARGRLAKALAASGARLVTGVDIESAGYNVPGAGVHREMALLVKAGLSPADAIRAATINCAEMLGTGEALGQIAPGFRADLFAVEGDPLANVADLRRIRLIVRGGEALNAADLLAQAGRAAR